MLRDRNVVLEPRREIPVAAECDVLVAGGGSAGFGAALAARRTGAETLLIEKNGVLGGAATAVLMDAWNCPAESMTSVARKVTYKLLENGQASAGPLVTFDPEALMDLEMDLLLGAGARLLLYTWAVEPLLEGSQVRGVIIQNKSGRQAILAKTVVDATGDGDMAHAAGCPTVKGRETDSKMRPVNTLIRIGGVDLKELLRFCRQNPEQFQMYGAHHIADPESPVIRLSGFYGWWTRGEGQERCRKRSSTCAWKVWTLAGASLP